MGAWGEEIPINPIFPITPINPIFPINPIVPIFDKKNVHNRTNAYKCVKHP